MRRPDQCSRCGIDRPKHGRWFWVDSNARPPVVFCPDCMSVVAPERVERRRGEQQEIHARAAATRRRRGAGQ